MKKVLFGFALIISCLAFSQKLKIKKDIAYIDGKEFVKVSEDPISRNSYTISSLNGNDLFYLRFNNYRDLKEIDRINKDGDVSYFEVVSPDMNTIYFETNVGGCLMCNLATDFVKMIYHSKVVNEDGTVDQQKLEILSKKVGFAYAQKRGELNNGGTNTVIIQDSRPRNGFNISLGR